MTEINGYKFIMVYDETAVITAPNGDTIAVTGYYWDEEVSKFMLDMARAFVDGRDGEG